MFVYLFIIYLCVYYYRETTLAVYGFSMVGMWIFAFTLDTGSIVVVYITASLLG